MRNVLLAVSGLSPQVITETLYALFSTGRPVHEVQVITTRTGRDQLLKTLLAPDGPLDKFLCDYDIPRETILFSADTINVVCDEQGCPLPDITDADSNESLLKLCLERTFTLTNEPDQAVFFLIAGGRKTMSACLTAAAQFYGRPQDRVFHVLVTPEFESCREFWYPPPKPQDIEVVSQSGLPCRMSTGLAKIQLIDMPFVSMREQLTDSMLKEVQRPAALLSAVICEQQPTFTVNIAESKLYYGELQLDIHPGYLALYGWFAERKKHCTLEHSCRSCTKCFAAVDEVLADCDGILKIYNTIHGARLVSEMSDSGIINLSSENFHSYKSKLKRRIEYGFGSALAQQLVISSQGNRPDTKYGIPLDKKRMRIIW